MTNEGNTDDAVKCSKCGSTQVHAEKRGWRLTTGFFGSSKIYITCLRCGNRFKPGDTVKYLRAEARSRDTAAANAIQVESGVAESRASTQVSMGEIVIVALMVIVIVTYLLMKS